MKKHSNVVTFVHALICTDVSCIHKPMLASDFCIVSLIFIAVIDLYKLYYSLFLYVTLMVHIVYQYSIYFAWEH